MKSLHKTKIGCHHFLNTNTYYFIISEILSTLLSFLPEMRETREFQFDFAGLSGQRQRKYNKIEKEP